MSLLASNQPRASALSATLAAAPFKVGAELLGKKIAPSSPVVPSMPKPLLTIVTPVLNDWDSLAVLIRNLATVDALHAFAVTVVAVDDGSSSIELEDRGLLLGCIEQIRIVRLKANQGHQRAIALGLAYVDSNLAPEHVIVMDSDGEDAPEAINLLLEEANAHPGAIIAAERAKRSEGIVFRASYEVYKLAFRYLTGKPISFGNFSLIPGHRLPNILYNSGIWNNFAATLLKSRLPLRFVPTERGKRYHGTSTMNFTSLMIHGFSAISVFTDVVIGRIISLLVVATIATTLAIAGIVIAKFGGAFVPGYATTVILFLVSMLLLCLFTGFLLILSLLAERESASALPSSLLGQHVRDVKTLSGSNVRAVCGS